MQRGDGVWNAVLPQIITSRHLPAEAVPPESDGHLSGIVRRSLDQNRNMQVRQAKGIGNRALFPEVGQSYDDAIDAITISFEQIGTAPGFFAGLDRSVFTFLRG